MKTTYKFISFSDVGYDVWGCTTKSGVAIGKVKIYKTWKQYCFFPNNGTAFSSDCLADIQHFLNQINMPASSLNE